MYKAFHMSYSTKRVCITLLCPLYWISWLFKIFSMAEKSRGWPMWDD